MGMAASQSRYLGLTARKINVEYEGQQVNQQRTALANQSAGLFQKLLVLEVPTPPSQNSYYKTAYTYDDVSSSDGKTKLKSITENPNSDPKTYTIVTSSKETVPQYGAKTDQGVNITGTRPDLMINLPDGTSYKLSEKIDGMAQKDVDEFNALHKAGYENETTDEYYSFTNSTTKTTYYVNATKTGFDPSKTSSQNVDLFSKMPIEQEVNKTITNAQLGKSADGIYNSINWTDADGPHTFKLTQTQDYDQKAYDDAMVAYSAKNQKYQKELADINAKTEQLQQTDRTLELRLKQLDTEQEALQTELDSVKKVIDKNVDNVFKTFQ